MTVIITILLLSIGIIIGSLVYYSKAKSNQKKKLLIDEIQKTAEIKFWEWDKKYLSTQRAFAWHKSSKTLLAMHFEEEKLIKTVIDFKDFKHCCIKEMKLHENESKNKNETYVSAIFLEFIDETNNHLLIEFYSETRDGIFEKNTQHLLAKQWNEIINSN